MQAILFDQTGDAAEVLACRNVATPARNDNDALVKVTMRPIHPADMAFIRGVYRMRPTFPQVAGLEGAGVVVEAPVGSRFAAGTRVAFRWPGSWAEFANVPPDRLIEVPDGIPDEVACQIALNPLTAIGLLDEAAPQSGDWLLLTAAASTVSNLVAVMAKARSINVIGLVRGDASDGKRRSQANHVFSVADPNLIAAINALTGERRVGALLDSVGGPIIPKLFGTLAAGGRIIAYGVQDREPAAVTNAMLIYSNLTWRGFGIDRWLSQQSDDAKRRMVAELWTLVRSQTLTLPVASTHSLANVRSALAADAEPGRNGKVLLVS